MKTTTLTVTVTHPEELDAEQLLWDYIRAGRDLDEDRAFDEDEEAEIREESALNIKAIFENVTTKG